MAGGVTLAVVAGIIILAIIAAAELISIFTEGVKGDMDSFTVLVYRKGDENFPKRLKAFLRERCWQEDIYFGQVYVVNTGVPEDEADEVIGLCSKRQDLIYITLDEFIKLIASNENSL